MTAWKGGKITPEQAIGQLKQLYAADAAASGAGLGQAEPQQLL